MGVWEYGSMGTSNKINKKPRNDPGLNVFVLT